MTKQSDKVTAMMRSKVDLSVLKPAYSYPDHHEKVTLQLSTEIQREKEGNDYTMVTWVTQCEAQDYFNEHGFTKTLDRMLNLRAKNDVLYGEF